MSNYMEKAFEPSERLYANSVMQDTWGHLAPEKNQTYKGFILIAGTAYKREVILDWKFQNLDSSPWFYEAIHAFVAGKSSIQGRGKNRWKTKKERFRVGVVYKLVGEFRNYKFRGTFKRMKLV